MVLLRFSSVWRLFVDFGRHVGSLFYLVHCTALRQRAGKGEALEGVGKLHCLVDIAVETPTAVNFALLVALVY